MVVALDDRIPRHGREIAMLNETSLGGGSSSEYPAIDSEFGFSQKRILLRSVSA